MRNYLFWPFLFVFLTFFSHDFFTYQSKFLELDFQLRKPKSILDGIFMMPSPDAPPLIIPSNPDEPKKLDPKAGNTADQEGDKSSGVSYSVGQS